MLTFFVVWIIIAVLLIILARISVQRMLAEGLREWEEELENRRKLEEKMQEDKERQVSGRIDEIETVNREKLDRIYTLEEALKALKEQLQEGGGKGGRTKSADKYIISGRYWEYECGDGCCDDWGYSVSINGQEITRDAEYDLQDLKQILIAVGVPEEDIIFSRDSD